ncbi:MAG: amidase [Methylocystis sp.]|uniref:amidase n=1 Tax=Methylocystis sp. TaxID=1911079 RepID=UPI003DA4D955
MSATRREVLIGAGALAAAPLAPACAEKISGSQWEYASARALADALRRRDMSAVELIDLTIKRIEALDPAINAVVVRDFDRARAAAKAADAALSRGETGALLGVPVTVKESFNIAGLPTCWGDPHFRHFTPVEDAVAAARLKKAGAIVLGKTNVPLWLSDWQSYNSVYGTTNHPSNRRLTPGGSSGGSAAALAAGFGALSLGSDMGGSLRAPAHYCGVYAHKPTYGLAPRRGHAPPGGPATPPENVLAAVGPMARSAADLALALDLIAGPEEPGYRLDLPPARQGRLGDFRVLVIDTHPLGPTARAIRDSLAALAARLARTGARVSDKSSLLPDLGQSARLHARLMSAYWGAGLPALEYEKLFAAAAARAPKDRSLAAERARGAVLSYRDWLAAEAERAELRRRWAALFQELDAVICPAAPTLAFPHNHALPLEARRLRVDGMSRSYLDAQLVWATLATPPGLPATVAPIGQAAGLPIGVQIIGPYLEDRTPLMVAMLMEREFGCFTPPLL